MSEVVRREIVQQAIELEPETFLQETEYDGPGKFEGCHDRPLLVALYILRGNGSYDEEFGSVSEDGYCLTRIDRYVIEENDQGFCSLIEFETEEEAMRLLQVEEIAYQEDVEC